MREANGFPMPFHSLLDSLLDQEQALHTIQQDLRQSVDVPISSIPTVEETSQKIWSAHKEVVPNLSHGSTPTSDWTDSESLLQHEASAPSSPTAGVSPFRVCICFHTPKHGAPASEPGATAQAKHELSASTRSPLQPSTPDELASQRSEATVRDLRAELASKEASRLALEQQLAKTQAGLATSEREYQQALQVLDTLPLNPLNPETLNPLSPKP